MTEVKLGEILMLSVYQYKPSMWKDLEKSE